MEVLARRHRLKGFQPVEFAALNLLFFLTWTGSDKQNCSGLANGFSCSVAGTVPCAVPHEYQLPSAFGLSTEEAGSSNWPAASARLYPNMIQLEVLSVSFGTDNVKSMKRVKSFLWFGGAAEGGISPHAGNWGGLMELGWRDEQHSIGRHRVMAFSFTTPYRIGEGRRCG